jgi:predicted XRE-type DNA-binding protein
MKEAYNSVWDAIEPDRKVAASLKIRAGLMNEIIEKIHAQGYSQSRAAKILGVTQPRVSDLMNGRIKLFSTDMLVDMLDALHLKVEVKVTNPVGCR